VETTLAFSAIGDGGEKAKGLLDHGGGEGELIEKVWR